MLNLMLTELLGRKLGLDRDDWVVVATALLPLGILWGVCLWDLGMGSLTTWIVGFVFFVSLGCVIGVKSLEFFYLKAKAKLNTGGD